ncbi:hypothetical protein LUZ60_002216 [Juncus effusus]|nr:hypothetical protein LUZ60_002216 [Juncus effusus]
MAQEIVSSLLLKLADAVFKEAILLYGVKDKVESVECELRWIQSFLKDADSKKGDNRVQTWVKDVREVSFLIEDVIDTFLLEVENLSLKKPGTCNTLKRVCKKPMKLVAMHNLDSAINNIHARLKGIQENKERYGIENLLEGSSTVAHVKQRIYPETDNIDIVGVDAEKNNIIELLLDEQTPRRSVVSIVGIGGLGKTTLAQKVYQSEKVKRRFEVSIWLNISQEFNTTDILKKMIEKLSIKLEEPEKGEEHFIPKIKEVLEGKRYLVVLDDIWMGCDLCNEMMKMNVLPDVNNGSRVLITTRFFEVATAADPKSDPYKLHVLNEEESLDLLFKKAYVDKNTNGSYPPDLLEPAKLISKKCCGLPLALVVVGGRLSTKHKNGDTWNKEIVTMNWQIGENACMKILATSYEDLPTNLKSCFVYLASFPGDWVYDAKLIIQLWVAEGFIPCNEPGTVEEIAEKYLEELAQRY